MFLILQTIKTFYAKIYLARNGTETTHNRIEGRDILFYVENATINKDTVDKVKTFGNVTDLPITSLVTTLNGNDTAKDNGTGSFVKC